MVTFAAVPVGFAMRISSWKNAFVAPSARYHVLCCWAAASEVMPSIIAPASATLVNIDR